MPLRVSLILTVLAISYQYGVVANAQASERNLTAEKTRWISKRSPCECGRRNEALARIVGGELASKNEFPWRCSIFSRVVQQFTNNPGEPLFLYAYKYVCGCTVISSRWILTAAHCSSLAEFQKSLHVFAGDIKLLPPEEGTGQFVRVQRIYNHPQYDKFSNENDISLLELEHNFVLGLSLTPACLPYKFKRDKFYRKNATVSGWGIQKHKDSVVSEDMRKAELAVLTTKQCRKSYKHRSENITDNMICAYAKKKDACQGDSGGSMDYKDPETGLYFPIGIISWGVGCASTLPGVYIKVAKYLKFMETITGTQFCQIT